MNLEQISFAAGSQPTTIPKPPPVNPNPEPAAEDVGEARVSILEKLFVSKDGRKSSVANMGMAEKIQKMKDNIMIILKQKMMEAVNK